MMRRRITKGFTLIETIIALVVLAVGLVAVLSLFPVGFNSAMRAADLTKAAVVAQWKMEDIKRIGYPVTAEASTAYPYDNKFSYTVTVADINPPGNLQQVTVTVSWGSYNEDFVTYITKYAP